MATKDWLFAILMAALGERPLGIQASQVVGTAKWLQSRHAGSVEIFADGPRTGLVALVAAALEPKAIAGVTIRNGMRSLKEIIEKDLSADKTPELFCFGLLETFDIDLLSALAGRDKVKLENGRLAANPARYLRPRFCPRAPRSPSRWRQPLSCFQRRSPYSQRSPLSRNRICRGRSHQPE